jgi:hypothetical protein
MAEKKKIYWLSTVSLACLAPMAGVIPAAWIFAAFKVDMIDTFVGMAMFICASCFWIAAPVAGILALVKINRSNDVLCGTGRANLVIVVSLLPLVIFAGMPALNRSTLQAKDVLCKNNLHQLGLVFKVYAEDHNDTLPEAENWCDSFMADPKFDLDIFVCGISGAKTGESSYAMNVNVKGLKYSELPGDMVLLFEAKYEKSRSNEVDKTRWNQVGGPELLSVDNRGIGERGCNILFADGDVRFIELDSMAEQRWKVEGEIDFPSHLFEVEEVEVTVTRLILLWISGIVLLIGACLILWKHRVITHFGFVIFMGAVSAGVGCFFGLLSEIMHVAGYAYDFGASPGMITGGICGLLVGMCYGAVLANTTSEIKTRSGFRGYAVSTGMAAGMICSTIVHLMLMILYGEKTPESIIGGMPFGVIAGNILGYFASLILSGPSE